MEQRLLREPLTILGQFASASNTTLLCGVGDPPPTLPADPDLARFGREHADRLAVYKPRGGEAPLWDFPDGTLYRREVAAYRVSRLLGWDQVPTTVVRADAPLGVGALQRFVGHDPERHYFALVEEGDPDTLEQLRRMVVFDLVVNNADRKGGHVLLDATGRVWLVDHGVCFHAESKLRTVAWHVAGEPIPDEGRAAARQLAAALEDPRSEARTCLGDLLAPEELRALRGRAEAVARMRTFPHPVGPRPYPWPLL